MTPILYEKDEIDFTSQGLGSLVEIYDVDVEEQRNGLLQLTASYPVSGVRYADISVGRIILAKPNQRDDVHAFRIVSTELDISGYAVRVEADSITYDLTHNLVKHLVVSGNGQSFMTALKNAVVNPSIFAFYSDIATSSTTLLNYVNPMEAIMGTTGSFLQIWGGELKRENRRVAMFNRRGRDNVATFRLGKNISGLKYSVDISSLVTRIIPTKSVQNDNQTTTTLEGAPVDSQYINNYEQIYTLPLEFTDDTIKTVADLNAAAKGWFTKSANTGRDKPTVTIDIDVLSLQDSADYQDKFKNLESVSLTDTVTVYVPEYGVNVTAIVNELHYDPILDRVTKMTVGTAKQSFADSSRTQLSDLQDKIISVQNQADAVAVSANGKSTNYYGSVKPSHPQEGDQWYWQDGDKSGIKQFINGEWMPLIDSNTQDKIAASVTDAVAQAKEHTATAIEQNNASQQKVMNDIAKSQADLAIKDGDFNNKAQAMADEALANAKANTATVAQDTLNSANQNIAAAKSDLTEGLQKEVSDRTSAVTALDTKAQGYVSEAKTDVLETVNKEVTDRQNAVTALDTKAQGYVSAARSDINDTINALSVGGRNYLLNSNGSTLDKWTPVNGWSIVSDADRGNVFTFTTTASWTGGSTNSLSQARTDFPTNKTVTVSFWAKASVDGAKFHSEPTGGTAAANTVLNVSLKTNWQRYSYTFYLSSARIYFMPVDSGVTYWVDDLQLEIGNMISDYSQATEDVVYDYTDKDNQIKQTFTQYQQSNDGKVSKAQTDATQALGLVATKVSQTDYDTKTGDLTTKYTQVKQTADSQATDIVDIKETATSQASKINSISSDVDGTKQSISDIETTQDSQSDKINQITTDVNGTKQSITDIQTKDGQQDTRMGTIETSVSGVKSDFSTYKTDANGRISTAQTTAQTAVDGLKTKVSQTDYNSKTGQLTTDVNSVTQTANQSKQDIVSINQKDGQQDSRMNTIESDASGTKQTVSNIQTKQGEQSANITTLQTRADGLEANVSKFNTQINDLQQINQLNNTEFTPDLSGWHNATGQAIADETSQVSAGWYRANGRYNQSVAIGDVLSMGHNAIHSDLIPVGQGITVSAAIMSYSSSTSDSTVTVALDFLYYDTNKNLISSDRDNGAKYTDWKRTLGTHTTPVGTAYLSLGIVTNGSQGTNYYSQPIVVFGGTIGGYVQGTYNNNAATAKAQLTADNASLAVSKLTSADGIITKAQADIRANAESISQKVSKTVYDKNTGDLNQAISKAQSTADGAVSTVGNYKTSNDKRVESAESKIEQNSKDITARVIQTDYDDFKGSYKSTMSALNSTFERITSTVSETETIVNKLNQNNLVNNSQLNPDYSGWHITSPWGKSVTTELWNNSVESSTGAMWVWHDQSRSGEWIYSDPINILQGSTLSASIMAAMPTPPSSGTPLAMYVRTYDANKTVVDSWALNINYDMVNATFKKFNLDNRIVSSGAKYASVVFGWNAAGTISFGKPMLVFGKTTGDYVAGPYNNNDKIASQQITINGITSIVSDPKTGLSTRVQTAEGTLSTVKGTDIPALQNATFWQPYSSLNFNDYTKQGSFFFNTSAGKTNSPTTSNAWIYLIVEQGTSDSTRIKQTAWYDGVAGVKITYVRTLNSGTWSPWYANDNDSVTTISQTNGNVEREISDRKNGDSNTLQSAKEFTQSSITSSEEGMKSTITQTSNAVIAQIGKTNLITNSEFDPLNYGWYLTPSVGQTVGTPIALQQVTQFSDWTIAGGSRGIAYNIARQIVSEPTKIQVGKKLSASVIAGRSDATNGPSNTLDVRLAFFDSNKNFVSDLSFGNPISNTASKAPQLYKLENITSPSNAYYVGFGLVHSGTVNDAIYRPMINFGSNVFTYSPTYGTSSSSTILSLLKDNWSIGIADNVGAITSGIVANSDSMSLISKNITLDGNTTVTGDFYAKGGNFTNLNASNITVGTLNGNQVNITNLNASNIVSGAISGANLNINLNTGQVQFQKGRIFKSDYTTDINIDQGYISTANDNTRALIKQGMIQLVAPNRFDLDSSPYMELSNNRGQSTAGAAIIGRDSVSISNSKNAKNIFPAPIGTETFSGLYTGQAFDGGWLPTKVAGADRGVVVAGGTETTWQVVNSSPYIRVGTDAGGSYSYGNRVVIKAEYLNADTVYYHGNSHGANVYVAADGALLKSSSATKYKTNIEHETDSIQGDQLLTIDPATWNDKFEAEQLKRYHETGVEPERQINMEDKRYYGIIAEDLVKAGLEELVTRNEETDEVEGVEYSKIGVALIPIVRDLRNKLNEQAVEIERLKDKNK
ncbi:phage tail spike protein [Leuconostoc mesenteroides]|uniref:phage tail spike protein n=1 Tax=Leuconostoc mesenteroides TaxID=1245 RepID=UPI00235F3F61|nr:phage tail spike protein [Leuconostoc mesenteroides]